MKDWLVHLDRLITAMGASVPSGAGSVSHQQAIAKAEPEYDKYRIQLDATPSEIEEAHLETVKRTQRKIEASERTDDRHSTAELPHSDVVRQNMNAQAKKVRNIVQTNQERARIRR